MLHLEPWFYTGNSIKVFPRTFSLPLLQPKVPGMAVYPDVSTSHMMGPGDPKSQLHPHCHHQGDCCLLALFSIPGPGGAVWGREGAASFPIASVCLAATGITLTHPTSVSRPFHPPLWSQQVANSRSSNSWDGWPKELLASWIAGCQWGRLVWAFSGGVKLCSKILFLSSWKYLNTDTSGWPREPSVICSSMPPCKLEHSFWHTPTHPQAPASLTALGLLPLSKLLSLSLSPLILPVNILSLLQGIFDMLPPPMKGFLIPPTRLYPFSHLNLHLLLWPWPYWAMYF